MTGFLLNLSLQVHLILSIILIGICVRRSGWKFFNHLAWIHLILFLFIFVNTVLLFLFNRFDFHSVWEHSSSKLPVYYRIASLWEGQKGSFFLWAFFQEAVAIMFLLRKDVYMKATGAALVAIQILLLIPVVQLPLNLSGTGLFASTYETLNLSEKSLGGAWTISEGKGLNPLLANIWMTIHPPVIFLSFALASVPYSLATIGFISSFNWLKIVARCLKVSLIFLSAGILLGAYWAYETLNFGGYWSWDPVENAIYLPWLIGLAAMHMLWLALKREAYASSAFLLVCLYFGAIIYSTFLTRSGVLANASVHSFVGSDYFQYLLILVLSTLGLPLLLVIVRKKRLAQPADELDFNNRPDFVFVTAALLLVAAFQIFIATSIPVFSRFLNAIGIDNQLAPAATTTNYSLWQGVISFLMLMLLILAELKSRKAFMLIVPLLFLAAYSFMKYRAEFAVGVILMISGSISFVVLALRYGRRLITAKVSGSLFAHIGFTVMVVGIIASSNALTTTSPKDQHTLLTLGRPVTIEGKEFLFQGRFRELDNGTLIPSDDLISTFRRDRSMLKDSMTIDGILHLPGDVVSVKPGDHLFKIVVTEDEQRIERFHRINFSDADEYFITPDIIHGLFSDSFLHISNLQDESKVQLHNVERIEMDSLHGGSSLVKLMGKRKLKSIPGISLPERSSAFMLVLEVQQVAARAYPVMIVDDSGNLIEILSDVNRKKRIKVDVDEWKSDHEFSVFISSIEEDYVIVNVQNKPLINLFWAGAWLIVIGMVKSLNVTSEVGKTNSSEDISSGKKIYSSKQTEYVELES